MAVLLECTCCFQNYAVPKQSLGRPTTCPWCGASSASAGDDAIPAYIVGNVPEQSRQLKSRLRVVGEPWKSQASRLGPLGTVGRPVITGPVQLVLASLPYANTGMALGDARSYAAPMNVAQLPRRDYGIPAVLWLVIGIGIGACVVLAAIAIWRPDVSGRDRNSDIERRIWRESSRAAAPMTPAGRSDDAQRRKNENLHTEQSTFRSSMSEDRQREMLRRIGEQMKNTASEAGDGMQHRTSTPRWMSNRPPPIGDPDDDSPPLGLLLAERTAAETNKVAPTERNNLTTTPRRADDPAALKDFASAGISYQQDSTSGLVSRVDGSFRMSDALMSKVAKLPNLVQLKLSFSNVTDVGLAHLKELKELKELILNDTKITDAAFAHIADLSKLEKLDLEKTQVTDASLAHLKNLHDLKHIDLRGTKITPAGVAELKQALPAARIRS